MQLQNYHSKIIYLYNKISSHFTTISYFYFLKVIVKDIDLNDEKYQYLFTVDSINNLVVEGMSFREAYQQIGGQVQSGTYKPDLGKQHTHVGSIHNLSLDKIAEKYPK